MIIQNIAVNAINPAKYNPRIDLKPDDIAYKSIKNSIEKFGYIDPIIWNEKTGNLVGGHQRFKILQELGYKEIPCVVVSFDDAQEKAANIALNKVHGDWDMDSLDCLLKELSMNFDMTMFGFELKEIPYIEVKEDDFDYDKEIKEIKEPIVSKDELWQLGKHYLYCGDSTIEEDMNKLMQGVKADLVVTDPPYNVNYEDDAEEKQIANDNMSEQDFRIFLSKAYNNIYNNMKDGASIYVFHADSNSVEFRQEFKNAKFKLAQICIWVKNSLVMGRQDYHWQHEPVIYGWKPTASHKWYSDRSQATVWYFDRPVKSEEFPTMKPIPLLAYSIENSSKPNSVILDAFGGSGSTLIAAEETDRICYMMELKPLNCDLIIRRYEKATGNKAVRLE